MMHAITRVLAEGATRHTDTSHITPMITPTWIGVAVVAAIVCALLAGRSRNGSLPRKAFMTGTLIGIGVVAVGVMVNHR